MRAHVRACRNVLLFLALLAATAVGHTQTQKPGTYPTLPSETPAAFDPVATSFDYVRRDVMIPMRDGVKLRTVILVPKGAAKAPILLTRTPYDAESLTSHSKSAHLGPILNGYDNAADVDRRWRVHPRRPGRPRQARVRGRLRDEPAAARTAESDARRSRDRHLRHDRLAREERAREQRQGRHAGHLLRRLPAADGARQSAPGAQSRGADEPDGRRLDGRRLVSQRRVPPADDALHLRPGGDARRRRASGGRATSTTTTCSCRPVRPASLARRRGLEQLGFWRKLLEHPAYDAFWRDQAMDKVLGRAAARPFPRCSCTASGTRKTSTAHPPSTRRSSRRTRRTTRCSS